MIINGSIQHWRDRWWCCTQKVKRIPNQKFNPIAIFARKLYYRSFTFPQQLFLCLSISTWKTTRLSDYFVSLMAVFCLIRCLCKGMLFMSAITTKSHSILCYLPTENFNRKYYRSYFNFPTTYKWNTIRIKIIQSTLQTACKGLMHSHWQQKLLLVSTNIWLSIRLWFPDPLSDWVFITHNMYIEAVTIELRYLVL